MSCRGSGGHLFVCTAFHKHCAVNHLRWRVSASQRRVQPALNTEDRRASILLWLFSLIAAHPPAEMLPLQMFGVIVPHLQFQSSGCFPTILEESARTEGGWGGQNFSLRQQSGKLKRGLLWFMHLHQYMDRLEQKRLVSVLLLMKWDIFNHNRCLKLSKLIFQSDIRRRDIKEGKILPIVSCVVHL